MEEAPSTPYTAPPTTQPQAPRTATPSLSTSPAPQSDRDGVRRGGPSGGGGAGERLGLTKEVLSAHTQQEEQNFLCRFRDLSKLRVFDLTSAVRRTPVPLSKGETMENLQHKHGTRRII